MKNEESRKSAEHWPRVGYPLLPSVYREAWADEPLPSAVLRKVGLTTRLTLGELDRTVWDRVASPNLLSLVANHVLTLVTKRLYFGSDFRVVRLPILGYDLPKSATLDALPLASRTINTLRAAGKLHDLGWLSRASAADLLALPNAGTRTLVDFATVVEEHYPRPNHHTNNSTPGVLLAAVEDLCEHLAIEFPADSISLLDPRISVTGLTVSSLAETLRNARERAQVSTMEELQNLFRSLTTLRSELQRVGSQKLDEALLEVLKHVTSNRHTEALAARLGWDGGGGCTLAEAAAKSGVTRERIRQVEEKAIGRIRASIFLPALDAAIARLNQAAAAYEGDVTNALAEDGLASRPFKPYGVVTAGRIFGREVSFSVSVDGLTVQKIGDEHFTAIRTAFKDLAAVNYVASVSELQARIDENGFRGISDTSTRSLLDRHPNIVWLDADHQWFWLRQAEGRNRYVNAARKILSVSRTVRIDILRDGVLRHHRSKGSSLPRHVLEGLCRATGLQLQAGYVLTSAHLNPADTLTPIEIVMLDVLRANGNVLPLYEFRDRCVSAGVNRHSFYAYVSYSPIIIRVAPSLWGLRGANIDPITVSRLLKDQPPVTPSLQDHGWTADGAIWVGYKVSRALFDTGVLNVPAGVHEVIGDGKLELYAGDGARVGNLTFKKLSAWGIGSFIDRRGVEVGDHLVISVDTELQMVLIQTGSSELLESFQEGLGSGPRTLVRGASRELDDQDVWGRLPSVNTGTRPL